ncbi:UNVERIFIED_CONTAM: Protein O-linked-mannose beta-1,4-N-acetylglucosaminyltransferase 2 [Siphonaria sp. JEL0065]|nr:Protein O-linked-mannose beta-1,4-N-acetylglucosaminyltransferase 2 [Siphonaria sp. JEL0065]
MRLRNQTKSDFGGDSDSKRKDPRARLAALNAMPGTGGRRAVSVPALAALVLLAFSAGLLLSSRVFGAAPLSSSAAAVVVASLPAIPQTPPTVPQQQKQQQQQSTTKTSTGDGEDSWRQKYEVLLKSVSDAEKSKTQSTPVADGAVDGTAAKDEKTPQKEANDAKLDKEKMEQTNKLLRSKNSTDHKVSKEEIPVFGKTPEIVTMEVLPASSVWCEGNTLATRVCKFRNICFNKKINWFIVRNEASFLKGVPSMEDMNKDVRPGLVEISTIEDHPYTTWGYDEVSQFAPDFLNRKVRYHTDFTILFKRFHASNIMHSLHDDVLPLFHHIREVIGGFMQEYPHFEFDLRNHRIQFVDDYEITETFRPFQYLTDLPIGKLSELTEDPDLITCFRDATAGVRKLTTWYQYGFSGPQGPIKNKFVNGFHVRMVADFFTSRLGLPTQDYYGESNDLMLDSAKGKAIANPLNKLGASKTTGVDYIGPDLIIILSRTRNRLIVNEKALAEHLERTFKHQVLLVRNEDHTLEEQIILMRRAKVVVAMHGSILIMGMFCRKGTVILELYPWAVPSENYTPYKTMSQLHGMHLVYRSWENKHPNNSISHPDWVEQLGGIAHLPKDEQQKILDTPTVPPHQCCVDPYWLFRIYQDTIVDIPEITDVLMGALEESAALMGKLEKQNSLESLDIMPPYITGPMFMCIGEGRPAGSLWIRWMEPWNGAKPDFYIVRTRLDGDESEDPYTIYEAKTNELFVKGFKPGTGVIFQVKSVVGKIETNFGDEAICIT